MSKGKNIESNNKITKVEKVEKLEKNEKNDIKQSKKKDKVTIVEKVKEVKEEEEIEEEEEVEEVEEVEVEEEVENENKNELKSKFDNLFEELTDIKKQIFELQKKEKILLKKIGDTHKNEMKKINSKKRSTPSVPTGFIVSRPITGKLAEWLDVENGKKMTGPELSKIFWKKMGENGLKYEKDGRVFRTDETVSEIFGVPMSVNKSVNSKDKQGFNLTTYQTYIKYALEKMNVDKEESKEKAKEEVKDDKQVKKVAKKAK
jgi:hypothetical protein